MVRLVLVEQAVSCRLGYLGLVAGLAPRLVSPGLPILVHLNLVITHRLHVLVETQNVCVADYH